MISLLKALTNSRILTPIEIVIKQSYKLVNFILGSGWCHIIYNFNFSLMNFTPLRVTQKSKYSISVCTKKEFSILNLGPIYLEPVPIYVHDLSNMRLLIPKPHLCMHR